MNKYKYIGLLILLFYSSHSFSASNAEQLLKYCESSSDYCNGYIAGFYDGRTTSDYGIKEYKACFPTESGGLNLAVSYEQMRLVFIKWAKDNPEKLHYDDWQAVREAFAKAWPCK
jgi:hypothetical protein